MQKQKCGSQGPRRWRTSEMLKWCTKKLCEAQAAGKGSPTVAWQSLEWDRAGKERCGR